MSGTDGEIKAQVAAAHRKLRDGFESGKTRGLEWRLSALDRCIKMLEQTADAAAAALHADLGIAPHDGSGTQVRVAACISEALELKARLPAFLADKPIGNSLLVAPSETIIRREPFGAVLM